MRNFISQTWKVFIMAAIYKPVIAKAEFTGHTFEELQFAASLKNSVDDFFKMLNGEKKGRNAKEAMLELMKETEDADDNA